MLSISCQKEFSDLTPALIVAALADQGKYVASESTFYRLLKRENLMAYRYRSKKPVRREPVETIAHAPNRVWSWDITYLRSRVKGVFFKLYAFEDLYSRKIVGWDIQHVESEHVAAATFGAALASENINGNDLRLHSDNGNTMRGPVMMQKLLSHKTIVSFSRPSVSNDNAFIESFFKTMKYSAQYPTKSFETIDCATAWVKQFVKWYNDRLHSGLNYISPNARHDGKDKAQLERRTRVYELARKQKPHRWIGHHRTWTQPELAQLNPYGTRIYRH